MKKLLMLMTVLAAMTGCRTTEANYRAAYEKAKAHRDSWNGIDGTIYDSVRRQSRQSTIAVGGIDIPALTVRVKLAEEAVGEALAGRYIVVGQFKQLFNARSMCRRFRDAGYGEATILMTAEPLYYVAAAAPATDALTAEIYQKLVSESPITLSDPYPQLLIPVK